MFTEGWSVDLAVTNGPVSRLRLGQAASGTDDFDPQFDQLMPPPAPGAPSISGQLVDIRGLADLASWHYRIDNSTGIQDIILSWDVFAVPAGLRLLGQDLNGQESVTIDMATKSVLVVPARQAWDIEILFGATSVDLSLHQGWNFISLPLLPLDTSTDAVFDHDAVISVMTWANKHWTIPKHILPWRGYQVFASFATTVTVKGRDRSGVAKIGPEWTAAGVSGVVPYQPRAFSDALDRQSIALPMWYDLGGGYLASSYWLDPFLGYWVYHQKQNMWPWRSDASARYPMAIAFRPFSGGVAGDDTRFRNYEALSEKDRDLTVDVESNFPHVLSIQHDSFATIGASQTEAAGVYPGHWLFELGTRVVDALDATQDDTVTIEVEDATVFQENDLAMIHAVDISGGGWSHIWEPHEEIKILSVIDSTHVEIKRSRYSTSAVAWTPDEDTAILLQPHMLTWANLDSSWTVNVSLASPQDTAGNLGYDIFADYVIDRFETLSESIPDGIVFDGGRWRYTKLEFPVDADNDLVADYGFIDGINAFGLGASKFMSQIREHYDELGCPIIVQADSSIPEWGYRSYGTADGMEMENFPLVENYGSFSAGLTHLDQWVQFANSANPYSYAFTKDDSLHYSCAKSALPSTNANFRVGLAASLMVGMPHAYAAETGDGRAAEEGEGEDSAETCFDIYDWDEYKGGDLEDHDWLGAPLTEAIRLPNYDVSDNLLDGGEWSYTKFEDATYAAACDGCETGSTFTLTVDAVPADTVTTANIFHPHVSGALLRVVPTASNRGKSATEFTVVFEAWGANTYNDDLSYDWVTQVPRLLRVHLVDDLDNGVHGADQSQDVMVLPASGELTPVNLANTFQANLPSLSSVTISGRTYSLSFRYPAAAQISRIKFESGEETGQVTIRNVALYRGGGDRFVRYFDNGAVILNMTEDAWSLNLGTTYSPDGYARLLGTLAAGDAVNTGVQGNGADRTEFFVPAENALLVRRLREF